jgi:hypothetical protein
MSGSRENTEGLNGLTDEERQIERLLAELSPRDSRISRDGTMFRAGQATVLSPATEARKKRWVWPAVTVCATAAGLLTGILIAGPSRPAVQIARQTSETPPAGPPPTVEHTKAWPETGVADAPALLELRIALARRAGDELAWAQSDLSAYGSPARAVDAPAAGSFAPLTYGAALGRLHAEEKDL